MAITALTTISGEIQAQPLNDNFSHIAEEVNTHLSLIITDDAHGIHTELLQRSVNVQWYGADSTGVNDSTVALQNVLAALGNNPGEIILERNGTYKITGTLDLRRFQHINLNGSTIIQYTDNIPIVKIQSSNWSIKNGTLKYNIQQTLSNAIGIQLGDTNTGAFEGELKNLWVENAYNGIAIPNLAGAFCYMVKFELIRTLNCNDWGFNIAGTGAIGLTTNTFINCYVLQDSNNNSNTASKGFKIANHDDVTLIGCAVDKTQYGIAYNIESCVNSTLVSCHAESNKMFNFRGLFTFSTSNSSIINCSIAGNVINVADEAYFIRNVGTAQGKININGFNEKTTAYTAGTVYAISSTNTGTENEIYCSGYRSANNYNTVFDSLINGSRFQIKKFNNFREINIGGFVRHFRTAMPTTGTWTRGDEVINSLPSTAGTAGNTYVVTGWKRLITGSNNVLNTDWVEMRTLTGT